MNGILEGPMELAEMFGKQHEEQAIKKNHKVKSQFPGNDDIKSSSKSHSIHRKRARHSDDSLSSNENLSKWKLLDEGGKKNQQGREQRFQQHVGEVTCLSANHSLVPAEINRKRSDEGSHSKKVHGFSLSPPATGSKRKTPVNPKMEKTYNPIQKSSRKMDTKQSYKCEECSKDFSQKLHLILHKRIHIEANLTNCTACGTSYPNEMTIRDLPNFNCGECEKNFTQKLQLILHQRVHRRTKTCPSVDSITSLSSSEDSFVGCKSIQGIDKPFKCDECEKAFSRELRLLLHKRIHDGKTLYKCPECGMPFSQQASLNIHKLVHNGKATRRCDVYSADLPTNSFPKNRGVNGPGRKRLVAYLS